MFRNLIQKLQTIRQIISGYAAYSLLLKVQGLAMMFCTLKIYGVSGFGQLQLLFGLTAFFNSVATFGAPAIAAGMVSGNEKSRLNHGVQNSIIELLRFSSINYFIIITLWFAARFNIPFFGNLSTLNVNTIFVIFVFGFVFQGNLLLLNLLNALNMPNQMIKISVIRIVGTLVSSAFAFFFVYEIQYFLVLLVITEIAIFTYQVFVIEALKWIPGFGLLRGQLKFAEYFEWIWNVRYQAVAGVLVAFSSLLIQNFLTVSQGNYENGIYNLVLRLAALFIFPLSVVNLTIFSRRSELLSPYTSKILINRYLCNSSAYTVFVFSLFVILFTLTQYPNEIQLLFSGCLFMLSTSLNSFSSNILIATQRLREWAYSDLYLGSLGITLTLLFTQFRSLTTPIALQIMSLALFASSFYSFQRLRNESQYE